MMPAPRASTDTICSGGEGVVEVGFGWRAVVEERAHAVCLVSALNAWGAHASLTSSPLAASTQHPP